ncbi:MAG: DUF805 domain-containing protein, partial [Tepidisphaeraceae bacterium]
MDLADQPTPPRGARIGPVAFFLVGVSLFALKFLIDRLVAKLVFSRDWSVLNYLIPNETYGLASIPRQERSFYLAMLVVALPFVCVGIVVTCRRLRDAELQGWLASLFFIPIVNLLFFAALSVIPSADVKRRTEEDDIPPAAPTSSPSAHDASALTLDHGLGAAPPAKPIFDEFMPRTRGSSRLLAILLPAPLATGATLLAAGVMRDYGWGLFVGMPFVVGMVSAILYGYREPRTLAQCFGTSILACIVASATLILFAIEGAGCLIMLMPLALPVAMMGSALGYSIQNRPERPGQANTLWAVTLVLPMIIIAESSSPRPPAVFVVTTCVEVAAASEQVWPNVIAFGEIDAPLD